MSGVNKECDQMTKKAVKSLKK
jgi:hypothetical protein